MGFSLGLGKLPSKLLLGQLDRVSGGGILNVMQTNIMLNVTKSAIMVQAEIYSIMLSVERFIDVEDRI